MSAANTHCMTHLQSGEGAYLATTLPRGSQSAGRRHGRSTTVDLALSIGDMSWLPARMPVHQGRAFPRRQKACTCIAVNINKSSTQQCTSAQLTPPVVNHHGISWLEELGCSCNLSQANSLPRRRLDQMLSGGGALAEGSCLRYNGICV